MRSRRLLAALCCAGMWIVTVADVAAQPATPPSEERCLAAYEQGQRLRLKHALLEARAELLLCAREPCPASFRPECLQWFDEVQQLVPSVIIHVEGDVAATDVRVSIDGVLVASRLDGTPIEVDPGEHVFRFEPAGRAPSEQRVLINVGQKARLITIMSSTAERPPASERAASSSGNPSLVPWVFAGVGGLALGSFAYFGATGLSQREELSRCTPYCKQADIDNTRLRFLVADASLVVSALSFGVALYYGLSASRSRSTTSVHLDASGGSSSAYVGVRGTF